MRAALARHDALAQAAVTRHRGRVVKMTGRRHARRVRRSARRGRRDARTAAGARRSARPPRASRCACAAALHVGVVERRDDDFFGSAVNRAARIMSAAHGGQILLSQAVAVLVARPPAGGRDAARPRQRAPARSREPRAASTRSCIRALRQSFRRCARSRRRPNNLPQQVTSFIGRERELAEVKRLLASTRLLTLVGAGGIGKTRLSLQVGGRRAWTTIPTASGSSSSRRSPIRASSTGRRDRCSASRKRPGNPVTEALVKYVKDQRLLLILDNCEHLIDACAELAKQLLQSGRGLKILASSREPLRVAGETTFPVPALAVPEPGRAVTPDSISRYAATTCSSSARPPRNPRFASPTTTPSRSPRSASGSTASRSRSSSRPRACARCPSRRSPSASTIASACSRAATARRCRASRRCAR